MQDTSVYQNPLLSRYASREMAENFSDDKKFRLWRKLWIALAEAEKELGLNITDEQIAEMKKYAEDINYEDARAFERDVRHDVMAHVKAFGKQAKCGGADHPPGRDLLLRDRQRRGDRHRRRAEDGRDQAGQRDGQAQEVCLCGIKALPTLGFTHLQPAQLTTVGKRATLWLSDLVMDYQNLKHLQSCVKLRGVKGHDGHAGELPRPVQRRRGKRSLELERRVVGKLGYSSVYGVTGQTYPRKFDYNVLCVLSQIAQSGYRFSNDIRLLAEHEGGRGAV